MNIFAAIVAAVVAAASCFSHRVETSGPDEQGYRWERTLPAFPATVHYRQDVYLQCELEDKALSCARRDEVAGTCDIYLPPNAEAWQAKHEDMHCGGWVHPGGLKW